MAEIPAGDVAITLKLSEVRDCVAVGIQEIELPLSVAPAGALESENVSLASLVVTEYEYTEPSTACAGGVLVNTGADRDAEPPLPEHPPRRRRANAAKVLSAT